MKDAGESPSAVALALAMLARRALTRAEVADKLGRRVDPDERDAALARLDEMRVLDDCGLAERVAHDGLARRGFGRHRIRSELLRRGVEPAVVEDAIGRVFQDEAERAAASAALTRFRKRRGSRGQAPQKEAAAEFRHLIGRGFPAGIVRDLLRDIPEISL
jgi:regulatory protein